MIWAIGDIHGMNDALFALIQKIRTTEYFIREQYEKVQNDPDDSTEVAEPTPIKLIFIGDYIDHGPSSRQVVDLIMDLPYETVTLMGNHEDLMLQFKDHTALIDEYGNQWFDNGGQATLLSLDPELKMFPDYKFDRGTSSHTSKEDKFSYKDFHLEEKYEQFFRNLKMTHTEEIAVDGKTMKFVFAHSSLYFPKSNDYDLRLKKEEDENFSIEDYRQKLIDDQLAVQTYDDFREYLEKSKLWIEKIFLWARVEPESKYGDFILIHGHTPTFNLGDSFYFKKTGEYPKKFAHIPYFMFVDMHPKIEQHSDFDYIFYDGYRYYNPFDQLAEINIDTGAVYNRQLTAIGLCPHYLSKQKFPVCQVDLSKPFRGSDNVKDFTIRVMD